MVAGKSEYTRCRDITEFQKRVFPGGSVVKNMPADAGDMGYILEDPTRHGATKPWCHKY